MTRCRTEFVLVALLLALSSRGFADDPVQVTPKLEDRLAATVDGKSIYVRQVMREIKRVFKDRTIDPQAKAYIEAQTLEQLIKRRLILSYLDANKAGASEQDLTLALQRVEKQLGTRNLTLKQHLKKTGLTEDEFRDALSWQIGWQSYLDRYLTDENLKRYFNQHRKQFDGTQLRVSQILIKVKPADDATAWSRARQQASAIRAEVVDGKISFADAARQHSQSPSGKKGGDIGFISRDKPMPEGFSRAAFELGKDEVSQPVRSKFGIHLIQCVDVKPGDKQWSDVKKELSIAVTRYLFDWVSDQQRKQAKIEIAQGVPHFRAGTTELAD
jgi:parvulin-like peptidyl-prolyl isomerase